MQVRHVFQVLRGVVSYFYVLLDVNGIKPGSNSIMTDKHTAEHYKTVCLGISWPVCDVYICSYINIARSINILDRYAIFDFTAKFSYK